MRRAICLRLCNAATEFQIGFFQVVVPALDNFAPSAGPF
jgi:hypothetical protein